MERRSPHFPRNLPGYTKAIESFSESKLAEEMERLFSLRKSSSDRDHYSIDKMISAVEELRQSREAGTTEETSSVGPSKEAREYARREIEAVKQRKSQISDQVVEFERDVHIKHRNVSWFITGVLIVAVVAFIVLLSQK